jgi:hypothetical protein
MLSGGDPALSLHKGAAGPGVSFALLVALIVALQFGPAIGLLGFRLTADERWTFNGGARDVLVAALLLAAVGSQLRQSVGPREAKGLPPSAHGALLLAGMYTVLALLSGSELVVVGLNLRRLILVPLLFVSVLMIPWTTEQIDRLFGLIVTSGVLVAVVGLVDLFMPDRVWTEVFDIEGFNAANNLDRFGHLAFAESGRFFSGDLMQWTGGLMRRSVSTYLEPTTLAAGMATLLVAGLARKARGYRATGIVMLALLCGLATISKGFVVFLLLLSSWRILGIPAPRHALALSLAGCATALVAARWELEGALVHIEGLATALRYLEAGNWFGEGIGAAGNYTLSGADFGEESGLGNVIGQVGILAVLSLIWVATLGRDVLRAAAARADAGGPWVAAWLLFWMATYLYSASSLGVGGNALGFLWLGLYLHRASGARAT